MKEVKISFGPWFMSIARKGAELKVLKFKGKDLIWKVDEDFWNKTSPILFPIVGSLIENRYLWKGNKYELPRHGFARDCVFEVVQESEDAAVLRLQSNQEIKKNYPFSFELYISYRLVGHLFEVTYRVVNNDESYMPFCIGGHPAFAISNPMDLYSLEFEKEMQAERFMLKEGLLRHETVSLPWQGSFLPLSNDLFKEDAIVLKNHGSNWVTLWNEEQALFKMNMADFPDFGIWTKPNAPFLCLEPWVGTADFVGHSGDISSKPNIVQLAPNDEKSFKWSLDMSV